MSVLTKKINSDVKFINFVAGKSISNFIYHFREDMEKVNIKFHQNGTVSFQHKKILQFIPELSVNKEQKIVVPNIPLLVSIRKLIKLKNIPNVYCSLGFGSILFAKVPTSA